MAIYLSLTTIVLVTVLFVRKAQLNTGIRQITRQSALNMVALLFIFSCLFWVSALRVNVGNDYAKYVEFMHLVYCNAYVPTEPGFNLLTLAIYHIFGYENYIFVFAVFTFFTVLFFMIAMWQQSEWFSFSFMMFMFLGYYFQSISTVRYYLALAMALYSIKFVLKKDWPRFLLIVLIAAMFHKSVLVILVLYPIASIKWKRWVYIIGGLGCVSCLFLQDFYLKVVVFLYPSYKDTEYLTGGTSYVNIARCLVILGFSIWMYKDAIRGNKANLFYFYCNIMALALYVFGSFLPIISRIGYYLTVTHILFIPALLLKIKDEKKRKLITCVTVIGCLGYFVLYMRGASADGVRILPYKTILFDEMPLTLSERGY